MIRKSTFAFLAAMLILSAGLALAQKDAGGEKGKLQKKDVTEPVLVSKVDPAYPAEAKADKVTGVVVLRVTINTEGVVSEAKAEKSPDSRLSEAAIAAVKQWKYKPARTKAGKAVEVQASITINFQLK